MLWFIPEANPDYTAKMHLVREWLIEFDDEGSPWREIGVGGDGRPVVAGPDARNHGFWVDSDMRLKDFADAEIVNEETFEQMWKMTGVRGLD